MRSPGHTYWHLNSHTSFAHASNSISFSLLIPSLTIPFLKPRHCSCGLLGAHSDCHQCLKSRCRRFSWGPLGRNVRLLGAFMCCLLEEAGIHVSLSNRFVQKSPQLTEKGSLRGRRPNQGPSYFHMRGGTVAEAYKSLTYTIAFRQRNCWIAALSEFIFLGLKFTALNPVKK